VASRRTKRRSTQPPASRGQEKTSSPHFSFPVKAVGGLLSGLAALIAVVAYFVPGPASETNRGSIGSAQPSVTTPGGAAITRVRFAEEIAYGDFVQSVHDEQASVEPGAAPATTLMVALAAPRDELDRPGTEEPGIEPGGPDIDPKEPIDRNGRPERSPEPNREPSAGQPDTRPGADSTRPGTDSDKKGSSNGSEDSEQGATDSEIAPGDAGPKLAPEARAFEPATPDDGGSRHHTATDLTELVGQALLLRDPRLPRSLPCRPFFRPRSPTPKRGRKHISCWAWLRMSPSGCADHGPTGCDCRGGCWNAPGAAVTCELCGSAGSAGPNTRTTCRQSHALPT